MSINIPKLFNNHSGDTIVEVLIALTILSSAFGISYATANRSLRAGRKAQEHSEALKKLESQAERVRSLAPYFNDPTKNVFITSDFCIKSDNTVSSLPAGAADCQDGLYSLYIHYDSTKDDLFTFTAAWIRAGGNGNDQEQILYKIHKTK